MARSCPNGRNSALKPAAAHLHDHQEPGDQVVGVNEEERRSEMIAGLLAQPANDLHPAINVVDVHELIPPEVVIQMDLVPALFAAA